MFNFLVCFSMVSINLIHCLRFEDNNISEYDTGGADLAHLGTSVFGKPNEESGKKVKEWNDSSEINPEELGNYIEGDILFPNSISKNGLIAQTARWPGGEVPFEINGYFNSKEREIIKKAMMEYHTKTCIRLTYKFK